LQDVDPALTSAVDRRQRCIERAIIPKLQSGSGCFQNCKENNPYAGRTTPSR
jgi:hypothetical protein